MRFLASACLCFPLHDLCGESTIKELETFGAGTSEVQEGDIQCQALQSHDSTLQSLGNCNVYNVAQWFRSDPRRQLKRHCAEIIPVARLLGIPGFPSTLLLTHLTMVEQLLTESIPLGVTRNPFWAMACCSRYDRAAQNCFMPNSMVSTWPLSKTQSLRFAAKPDLPNYTVLCEGNLQIHAIAVFAVEIF